MKIDKDGNIEVESDEDYDKKIINDYGFTSEPSQIIYTRGLASCVGLGFVDEADDIRKRGLIHVFYRNRFERDSNDNIILPVEDSKKVKKVLDNFLYDFETENEERIFTNPRAIMVYVRSLPTGKTFEKIKLRDEFTNGINEVEAEDFNRYENPMADYIKKWLEEKNITLYGSNATSNKKLPSILNMEDDPKEIYHKEFSIWHDQIRIGMFNKQDVLLNK